MNAAVDAVRFNGASASSYTLPGGYSFAEDAELDHARMVEYSAVAGAGGKVMIDSGEYASFASKAMNADGSDSAAFAAKADAGYVFANWTGDVDAIISGTTSSLVVNVNAAAPISLTANFRSSLPYISSVTAAQDPVSRHVKVTYKLAKDAGVVTLNVETNANPGGTAAYVSVATQNVTHVSGDVHKFVDKAGETCTIWWQPDKSWPGQSLENVRVRVEGWQEDSPRLHCAVNTNNGDRA